MIFWWTIERVIKNTIKQLVTVYYNKNVKAEAIVVFIYLSSWKNKTQFSFIIIIATSCALTDRVLGQEKEIISG